MNLEEAIIYDYIGEGTLLHFTNPKQLISALKKGKIYVGRDGLKTIRPSAATKDNISDLHGERDRPGSYQTKDTKDFGWDKFHGKFNAREEQQIYDSGKDFVKIVIDGSKLKGGEARGLKIEKKNEDNKTLFNKVKHFIGSYRDDDAEMFIKEVSPFINKLHTSKGGKKASLDELYNSIPDKLQKSLIKKYTGINHRGNVMSALEAAYNYRGVSRERKGTEVINYKKKSKFSSIPLNRKYMKIEFLKKPTMKGMGLIELAQQIKDNKKLFKSNAILEKIIKDADAMERGEKPEREKTPIKPKKKIVKEKSAYHDDDKNDKKGFRTF